MADTQTGLALFNAIATAGKTIYDIAQGTSKLETKRQLMDVYDTLMNLKCEAADLEDATRDLKEQLCFKGADFEFSSSSVWRKSLSFDTAIEEKRSQRSCNTAYYGGAGGPDSWMRR